MLAKKICSRDTTKLCIESQRYKNINDILWTEKKGLYDKKKFNEILIYLMHENPDKNYILPVLHILRIVGYILNRSLSLSIRKSKNNR